MLVILLFQKLFSQTIANSLKFYKSCIKKLKNCNETIKFYEWINSLFDALNIFKEEKGVTEESPEYKVKSCILNCQELFIININEVLVQHS